MAPCGAGDLFDGEARARKPLWKCMSAQNRSGSSCWFRKSKCGQLGTRSRDARPIDPPHRDGSIGVRNVRFSLRNPLKPPQNAKNFSPLALLGPRRARCEPLQVLPPGQVMGDVPLGRGALCSRCSEGGDARRPAPDGVRFAASCCPCCSEGGEERTIAGVAPRGSRGRQTCGVR